MSIFLIFVSFSFVLIGIFTLSVKLIDSKASKMAVELLSNCHSFSSIKEVSMKYQENDGMKARVWPKGYCDLYFCDKYVIVVKRHHFILNFQSKPIVFGTDIPTKMSGAQKKLIKAKANKVKRGEFHLEFTDKVFQHYKYELNLFGLSAEQIDNLELLSSWVRT